MQLHPRTLHSLALRIQHERLLQDLSREQLAAVCNVSTSFIRDAEKEPGSCSVEKLLRLVYGLGLRVNIEGWQNDIKTSQADKTQGSDQS